MRCTMELPDSVSGPDDDDGEVGPLAGLRMSSEDKNGLELSLQ